MSQDPPSTSTPSATGSPSTSNDPPSPAPDATATEANAVANVDANVKADANVEANVNAEASATGAPIEAWRALNPSSDAPVVRRARAFPSTMRRDEYEDVNVWTRFMPRGTAARIVVALSALGVVAYTITVLIIRYRGMADPWGIDGDQPQAVFHYWRYRVAGAFPPGDLHTDYAFVMHAPPVWWALMSSLSTFMSPLVAAKALNIVAVIATCIVMFVAATRRSHALVGLAAVLLLMRYQGFTGLVAGGYARSFGPMLTLLFFAAFFARRHYLTLAVLVFQAAFYPSVVIPCGIAYGLYTCIAGPTMRERLRRMAGMFVAGLLIIACGKFQDLAAPKWWGPLVRYEEAEKMPAWHAGGRVAEVPMKPLWPEVYSNGLHLFQRSGHVLLPRVTALVHGDRGAVVALVTLVVVGALFFVVRRVRRQRFYDAFPWEIPLTFAAAFVAYLIARHEAFQLYLPYRPLQHVWPYAVALALPLSLWTIARNIFPRAPTVAAAITALIAAGSVFALFGDATDSGPKTYVSFGSRAPLYMWMRTTPVHAVFGGEFAIIDRSPLLSWHRSYVMRNLAHPFRAGYYNEAERRIIANYDAMYASNVDDVVAFAQKEHVDYLVYRPTALKEFDTLVFNGPRAAVEKVFKKNKPRGFALEYPPDKSVVYRFHDVVVVDTKKLADAVAAGDRGGAPMLGPQPEPSTPKAAGTPSASPSTPEDAPFVGPVTEEQARAAAAAPAAEPATGPTMKPRPRATLGTRPLLKGAVPPQAPAEGQ